MPTHTQMLAQSLNAPFGARCFLTLNAVAFAGRSYAGS